MPRPKKYVVELTGEQRAYLLDLIGNEEAKAHMLTRARILLLSAEGKTDPWIADGLKVNPQTVRNIRKWFARREMGAWEEDHNAARATVAWRFTMAGARLKLHRLYPQ